MTPRFGAGLLLAAACAVAGAAAAQAAASAADAQPATLSGSGYVAQSIDDRVDLLVREGFDRPDEAKRWLLQLRHDVDDTPAMKRLFLQAEATIEAQGGAVADAGRAAEQLLALSRDAADPQAVAASNLVRALVAENAGQLDVAAALAQSALNVYQPACPSDARAAAPAPMCDYRSVWRVLHVLERRSMSLGQVAASASHARAAFELADWAGDPYRKPYSLSVLAYSSVRNGQADDGLRAIAQAKRMAGAVGDPALVARVLSNEARIADARGDRDGVLATLEEALGLAQRAEAPRLQAQLLSNLTDAYAKRRRPADALRAADMALPIVRRFHDQRAERVLINNAGLAKIGLQRIAEGKQDLARVIELWRTSGAIAEQAAALREYGEALASAGDARGALELFHRERALSTEVMQNNRSVALKEMQTRYDAEAKQRSIDLLNQDNALKTAALSNRDLMQRIWALAAAVLALSVMLAALLYRRVRETQRQLEASHAKLRVQSERDPLTNLANRRHFQAVMQSTHGGADSGFAGTLLMVDIDHFKHINDGHGHAAGDRVLVEVARRLNDAVRGDDLVVRWGGEEFLIVASGLATERADQLAARVLASIGGAPVLVDAQALHVTASVGYARFPLPPYAVPVPWEQAVNFADMALYTAKNQGRNRAVGLVSASAPDAQALRAIEDDFDRNWHEGRVTLRQTPGPQA
jgi:diguanylate cyclase (GGDEF)-like protein